MPGMVADGQIADDMEDYIEKREVEPDAPDGFYSCQMIAELIMKKDIRHKKITRRSAIDIALVARHARTKAKDGRKEKVHTRIHVWQIRCQKL